MIAPLLAAALTIGDLRRIVDLQEPAISSDVSRIALTGIRQRYPDGTRLAFLAQDSLNRMRVNIWNGKRTRVVEQIPGDASDAAGGIALLPYVEPILPENTFIAFNKAVGPKVFGNVTVTEHQKQNWMTQDWADMHGRPQLAGTVQRVYDKLTPAERAKAVVFAQNYGEASAVAFFTHIPVISGRNQYYLWGTPGKTGDVMIDIDGDLRLPRHHETARASLVPRKALRMKLPCT